MGLQFACLCPLTCIQYDFANYSDLWAAILRNSQKKRDLHLLFCLIHVLSLDFSYMTVIIDLNFTITTEENPQMWLIS